MQMSFIETLGMRLRKVPVGLIKRILSKAEEADIELTPQMLETHYLSGGDIEKVVDALLLAKQNGIETDFMRISVINLTGRDPVEIIESCLENHCYKFDQYSPDYPDKIRGFCKDGTEVFAACKIDYRLSPNTLFGFKISMIQEHLSAKISIFINIADSYERLMLSSSEHKANLLKVATEKLDTVQDIEILYSKA